MMQKPTQAVLLVGSPKGQNSTSNSLGTYLLEKLEQQGLTSEKVYINQSIGTDEKQAAMLRLVDESDLIILAFPLYVDSLHSQLIKTLELIAEHEKGRRDLSKKNLVAIANSGFPEAKHNNIALNVCRIFAKQVGFTWAGGIAMGGGGMISGRPLKELGGMVRNQKKALEMAADSLAKGEAIPEKAAVLISKIGIPKWMYIWMGNRGWKQEAKQHIAVKKLYNKPFNASS
jgi:multimeric flavodoxin WrbA